MLVLIQNKQRFLNIKFIGDIICLAVKKEKEQKCLRIKEKKDCVKIGIKREDNSSF
jgi:hypothetical protein